MVEAALKVFYGPPDYLISKFSARDRRAFGFWVIIFSIIGTIFWGGIVLWVSILSVIALVPNYTTETPVETESIEDSSKSDRAYPDSFR